MSVNRLLRIVQRSPDATVQPNAATVGNWSHRAARRHPLIGDRCLLKESELKSVRDAIALRSDPVTRSVEDAQQLRADLALERRLGEVSEWPFDAGSYTRVCLYVFLGLGSWVGAAVVERLVESLGS